MSDVRRATILVGVDGSPESLVAAKWAAVEAERRHLSLLMILAINEPLDGSSDYVFPPPLIDAVRTVSRDRLGRAAAVIRDQHPALDVQTSLEFVDPRRFLVAGSSDVQMTIVGTRGRGQLPEVLVGSVALYVAAHAHSPVAVIPPSTDVSVTGPSGPILVGIDGHPDSRAAVGFAFDEASVQETDLLAVLVFDELPYRGFAKGANLIGKLDDDEEHAVLAEELAGWRERYPDVPVRQVVLRGRPARALVGFAKDRSSTHRPRLIVVGARGRGGLAGLLLGSTSQQLITHADVPIIVVRPDTQH